MIDLELYDLLDAQTDQDCAEFLALLTDAVAHDVYDGECYCPDSWQMARELVAESDTVSALLEGNEALAEEYRKFDNYGRAWNWQNWIAPVHD